MAIDFCNTQEDRGMEKEQMQARIADLVERTDRAEELAEGYNQPPTSEIHPHPAI